MAKLLVIVAVLAVILGTQQIYAFTGTDANPGGEITVGVDGWVMDAAGQAKAAVVNVRLPRSGAYAASVTLRACDGHILASGVTRIAGMRTGMNRVTLPFDRTAGPGAICSTSVYIAQR